MFMGRRTVLVDDFDGKELPDGTRPIALSLGRTTYNLYLSEKNHGKLLEALEPFIKEAETVSGGSQKTSAGTDKERLKKIREWAQANKITHNGKPLGDRGRIPQDIIDRYDEEN